jgi:hypothetical protein
VFCSSCVITDILILFSFEILSHSSSCSPSPLMISYERELDIDNKLNNYLKITGVLNNVFRPQKLLRKQE